MCGVFGIYGHKEAANLTYLGLHALQHRGQESAGIVTSDGSQLSLHRGMGHVIDVFPPEQLERLGGPHAIGHVRYSTAGGSALKNAQPIAVDYARGSIAVAHNGNLTNAEALREKLEERGSIFQSTSDTEVIVHLFAMSQQRSFEDRVADALSQVQGAYSLLILTPESMIAIRDPMGIRPLCLGKLPGTDTFVVASEPSSFDLIDAEYIRDIEPGEMLVIDQSGVRSVWPFAPVKRHTCIFEYVYFARPDSNIDRRERVRGAQEPRASAGARARRKGRRRDSSSRFRCPRNDWLCGRISPAVRARLGAQPLRGAHVHRAPPEHSPLRRAPEADPDQCHPQGQGRGGSRRQHRARHDQPQNRQNAARRGGKGGAHAHLQPAHQVALLLRHRHPTRGELIASSHSVEEINQYITSDTLAYLSLDSMVRSVVSARTEATGRSTKRTLPMVDESADASLDKKSFCTACWTGEYPIKFTPHPRQNQLRLLDL